MGRPVLKIKFWLLLVKFCVALPAGVLKVTQEHRGKLGTHMRPSGRVAVEGLILAGKVRFREAVSRHVIDRSFWSL